MKQTATQRRTTRVARDGYIRERAVLSASDLSSGRARLRDRRQRHRRHRTGNVIVAALIIVAVYWLIQHLGGISRAATAELQSVLDTASPTATTHHTATIAASPGSVGTGAGASHRTTAVATGSSSGDATTAQLVAQVKTQTATHPTTRTGTRSIISHPALPVLKPIPASVLLQNDYQVYETWNNCGPASLSMALSYFGIDKSQAVLGQDLRPYQNPYGDNDDKNVTMDELGTEAHKFGLLAYHRPNGTIQLLKEFIANGLPVIADTVLTKDDDIGHYRVVKGYDDTAQLLTQDDSMQGHNVQFSYADFDYMWAKFNHEYVVLVPKNKQLLAEAILGRDLDARTAWQETVTTDEAVLAKNPTDTDTGFNLSVALYYVGAYQKSVAAFEAVQSKLSFRTLWYDIEPIEAYYALGDYQKVFALSDTIFNDGDRAFSELYILRGKIDQKQGNSAAARAEFEKAVFYNKNMKAAQEALASVE